jgi:IS4 transposase
MTAARYLMVVTSLDAEQYPARKVLALYRMRWQIELAFKRLKSLLRFDRLPAKDKDLARTWLNSHLLLALVLDKLTQQALDSPPCAARNAWAAALYLARPAFAQNRSPRHRPARR